MIGAHRHHIKETTYWHDVKKVLDDKFNGNPLYMKEAERIVLNSKEEINKYKAISNILSSIAVPLSGDLESKTTRFDLKNKELSILYPTESSALLAYSLDTIGYRKLFPTTMSVVFNKAHLKDVARSKNKVYQKNVESIYKFIKTFLSSYNLTVNKIQKDANNGFIQFETTQTDPNFGSCKQYITTVIDKNKQFSLNNIKDNMGDLAKNYNMLFNYFTLFGFSDIYGRCTCRNYTSRYTRKRGMQNYHCNHLLYSMSMFPYYAMYLLNV